MSRTLIENHNNSVLTLPTPYGHFLPPGAGVVVADSEATVIANLGGIENVIRGGLLIRAADSGSAVSGGSAPSGRQNGVIPSARLPFSATPADGDTITIGGKTFTFKTTLVAATTTTQVHRTPVGAVTAAGCLANLLAAINGTSSAEYVENTTPFAAKVKADAPTATSLRIRKADARGGNLVAGIATSTALAASITAGGSWSNANLTETGKDPLQREYSDFAVTLTQAMVTADKVYAELPFALGDQGFVQWKAYDANHAPLNIEIQNTLAWSSDADANTTSLILTLDTSYTVGLGVGCFVVFRVFQ